MSAKVDVLGGIRLAAKDCRAQGNSVAELELLGIAAAVAELIEADREYDTAKEHLATQRRQVGAIDQESIRFQRAVARRKAALDNIGPQS